MRVRWRLVVGSVAVALIVAACGGTDEGDSSPRNTTEPGENSPTTTTAQTSGTSASTGDPAPEGERVYYAYQNGRIVAVDPDTGELVEIMVIDPAAGQVTSVTQGGGSMWLTTDSASVLRVNLDSREVEETIALASSATPFAAAYGGGALWVSHGIPGLGEAVSRVDSDSNTADLTVTPPDGLSFFEVAVGDGAVWVIGSGTEMATVLYEVDPATGEFTVHEVPAFMRDVAVGEGAVWVTGAFFDENFVASNGVGRFDVATGVLDVVETDGETWTLGVGSGGVWATLGIPLGGAELVRVDPASLSVTDTLAIGDTFSGNIDVTFGAGFVWAHKIATFDGAIYAIDPTGPEVVGSGDSPTPYGLVFP